MDRAHVELLVQGRVGLDAAQVLGQGGIQIVVDLRVGVAVDGRHQQHQKQGQEQLIVLGDFSAEPPHVRQPGPVGGLDDGLVEHQNQCGQDGYTGENPQDHCPLP